jgi:hypothetical protein
MSWRTLALAAAGTASILGAGLTMSQPAEARSRCTFVARDTSGRIVADGFASAIKMSWACNRAQRRCNRELQRKLRRGIGQRGGGCHKLEQAVR